MQTGNLSNTERALSAIFGIAFAAIASRSGRHRIAKAAAGTASAALFARAFAGHCAGKAALAGTSSLADGIADQIGALSGRLSSRVGLPGSPAHVAKTSAIDDSIDDSFPASDPPASRIPDVPPVNAQAKWDAARNTD